MALLRLVLVFALLSFGTSLGYSQQSDFTAPNNLFTAAGFLVKYATTPEKRAILRSLPPDKLVKRVKGGTLYYVYADAARCNCAYVGTQQAYDAYQNGGISPGYSSGGPNSNAMQTIDSDDVGEPYIATGSGDAMESILQPDF